jgi:hypothetical protein
VIALLDDQRRRLLELMDSNAACRARCVEVLARHGVAEDADGARGSIGDAVPKAAPA